MTYDPFGSAPEDAAPAEPETTTVFDNTEATITTNPSTGEWTATFKAGAGFDSPWIVAKEYGAPALLNSLGGSADGKERLEVLKDLVSHTVSFSRLLQREYGGAAPAPSAGRQAPAASQQAPSGQGKTCRHGDMVYKTGVNAASGKTWKAFMCPQPKGADQCDPEWIR